MTPKDRAPGTGGRILWLVIGMASGLALGALLLATPLGARLGLRAGAAPTAAEPHGGEQEKQLWTCGMHPQVVQDEPGQCPICGMDLVPLEQPVEAAPAPAGERKILFYRNPMNPTITSPVPMKDEMGMDYVPVYADEVEKAATGGAVVTIDPAVVQNMGVVTEKVVRRDLKRPIRTVGYLDYDQEKMVTVTTKYSGFVEKTYVNYIGQEVRKGDPLFEVYSPELVQTEQELLSALEYARRMATAPEDVRRRAEELLEAARRRLAYWDITEDQIRRLEETGTVFRTLTVTAPSNGVVMKRMHGLEGMAIRPGMDVIHIADLSTLWLTVEVYEDQLAWIDTGSSAHIRLTYFPGEEFSGRVLFVEPQVSEKTRTVRVTLRVPNPSGKLRAGMYAEVEFEPVVVRNAVAVPSYAVIRTGQRDVVIVALGGGRFAPREVELGRRGGGYIQVISGLQEGEEVVTSAQFLIDSESNLREAIQKMLAASGSHKHR
ncbi:MAG: efflux RND transporter periplasmic adaptor subunit [Acidobacteria bacterium]|nr:MAG: efflux RND transporter periplasmic adaptor subunit [Acidobacteriota bacterium]